ncbi:hypothetical protein ACMD2_23054, partial [Ananas comosus]
MRRWMPSFRVALSFCDCLSLSYFGDNCFFCDRFVDSWNLWRNFCFLTLLSYKMQIQLCAMSLL